MSTALLLLFAVIFIALAFEFINGFHDTANSIATVVATKVLSPAQAVMLAAFTNLFGAMWGTAVAKTVASGLIDLNVVQISSPILICALLGGIVWNLLTWWLGLPSSSSHALVGGLCGAALAASDNNLAALIWSEPASPFWHGKGLLWKVVIPMMLSPLIGFVLGFIVMGSLFALMDFLSNRKGAVGRALRPAVMNRVFGGLQIASAASMGWAHGSNDAQKTMGIIALALVAAAGAGTLDNLPASLQFLAHAGDQSGKDFQIATWIVILCAITMMLGTAMGGWRIIKTLGHKLVKLQPINGFAAESTAATVILTASHLGIPVSTTHNISCTIMGVGTAKRMNAIKWQVVERMLWAWVLTIPASGLVAYLLVDLLKLLGVAYH
jgi:inorganic phosphate transporter, PiT family